MFGWNKDRPRLKEVIRREGIMTESEIFTVTFAQNGPGHGPKTFAELAVDMGYLSSKQLQKLQKMYRIAD